MDAGTALHHRVRHDWLVRLRELRLEADRLLADGRFTIGVHRHRSIRSREAMHVEVTQWFGRALLFEVEVFRAEDLPSPEDARGWIEECANAALAATMASLEDGYEVKRDPDWLPELAGTLGNAHRRTVAALEPSAAADCPVPAYRWRLPTEVHAAAWDALTRRWLSDSYPRGPAVAGSCTYEDLLAELHTRGPRRVLLLHHPVMSLFSCETDVSLLEERRFDWLELKDSYLTTADFDWFIEKGLDGEWNAYGPRHR